MSLPGFEPLTLDKRYLCKIRKKTPPPPRFEPGTIGMSVERANHQTIKSGTVKSHVKYQMKVFYQFVSFHDCEMIFKKIAFKPSKLLPQATIFRLDHHCMMYIFFDREPRAVLVTTFQLLFLLLMPFLRFQFLIGIQIVLSSLLNTAMSNLHYKRQQIKRLQN